MLAWTPAARVPAAVERSERLGAEQQGREDHQQEDRTDRLAGRGAGGIEPGRREPTDGGGEDEPRDDRDARVEPAHDEQGDRRERDRHQREDEEVEGPEEPQVDGGPVLPSGRLRGVGQPDPPGSSPQTGVSGRRGQQMVTQAGDHQTDDQRPPRVGDREAGYLEAAEHRRLERGGPDQQGQDVRKPHPARQDRLRRGGGGRGRCARGAWPPVAVATGASGSAGVRAARTAPAPDRVGCAVAPQGGGGVPGTLSGLVYRKSGVRRGGTTSLLDGGPRRRWALDSRGTA